jgi:hypothetical protein
MRLTVLNQEKAEAASGLLETPSPAVDTDHSELYTAVGG